MSEKESKKISYFYEDVVYLIQTARKSIVQNINLTMVCTYFEIGKMIVEQEQDGKERASYGKELLKGLSKRLCTQLGKGFSQRNLEQMRQFYLAYKIPQTLSAELVNYQKTLKFQLSWSHYQLLMRIKNLNERQFYEIESIKENWSVRELKRQFDTGLYERLSLSRDKEAIQQLSKKGQMIEKTEDIIKDPLVLEFTGLKAHEKYSETDLENSLINKLEYFLLELGKGFTFVARQKRISFDERHFFIDLVFFNRLLKCFVIIDLKIGDLKHQDIGQMQMYVNYYDRHIKLKDENKTVGIILCRDKSDMLVKMTLPKNNQQIFASKYETVLPSKEEFKRLLK